MAIRRLLAEIKLWSEAFFGIDDLQGDQVLRLEERVRRLEQVVASATGVGSDETLDRPTNEKPIER